MNRRSFLGLLGAAIAGVAVEQVIPFGRIWSFPKEIVIAPADTFLATDWISMKTLMVLREKLVIAEAFDVDWGKGFAQQFQVGSIVKIKTPTHSFNPVKKLKSGLPPRPLFGIPPLVSIRGGASLFA